MRIGSDEHKALFCETFIASHTEYVPDQLPWPELDDAYLARLRAIPFWKTALGVEQNAGRMVAEFARSVNDPLVREAVALQGREEARHAVLLRTFLDRYGLDVASPPLPPLNRSKTAFTVFGYEECLDSYFGFGAFGIARATDYMPESLLSIFEHILVEEARHIVFFVNWVAWQRVQDGVAALSPMLSTYGYLRALARLVQTATSAAGDGTGFIAPGSNALGIPSLTIRDFLESCEAENKKYMSAFDERLLQPRVLPNLGSTALRLLAPFTPASRAAVTR
jgi:hypothetical protein